MIRSDLAFWDAEGPDAAFVGIALITAEVLRPGLTAQVAAAGGAGGTGSNQDDLKFAF